MWKSFNAKNFATLALGVRNIYRFYYRITQIPKLIKFVMLLNNGNINSCEKHVEIGESWKLNI